MKKQIFKCTVSMAALVLFAMLFTSCETDASEIAQMSNLKAATALNDIAAATPTSNFDATQVCNCLLENYPFEELSAAEVDALLFMREEEKLAHDVYIGMKAKWGVNIFSNISNAEQRHMDAVLCLINKYDLDDPVGSNAVGAFNNANLQLLYNNLMTQGSASLKEALKVGATIEDLDIADLLERTPNMDNKDIIVVFSELTKGSRNHLRAFNRNLVKQGETYVPQYISQVLFDEIINSPKETGGSTCVGTCTGNGPGNGTGNCNGSGPQGNGSGNGPGNGNGTCDGTGPNGNNGGGGNGPGNGGGGNGGGGNGPGNGNGGGN